MRDISENISQWSCGRYFFCWQGDEILMKATTDKDALVEGDLLLQELTASEEM